MSFIIAQICGLIAFVIVVLSVHFKSKESIVMCVILANLIMSVEYFLLNAITGAVVAILCTVRCIVFYVYKKKNLKPSLITLIIFEIVTIVTGIISWQNIWSLLPIFAALIYTYGLWQDNVTVIRITTGIVGLNWTIYDLVVKAFVGAIQDLSQFISAMVSLYRERKSNIKNDK